MVWPKHTLPQVSILHQFSSVNTVSILTMLQRMFIAQFGDYYQWYISETHTEQFAELT